MTKINCHLSLSCTLMLVSLLFETVQASEIVYVSGESNQFGILNIQTRIYSEINASTAQPLFALASYNQQIYGMSSGGNLYKVTTGGNLSSIGSAGRAISGLAFNATGTLTLYANNFDGDSLGTLNVTDGGFTRIGSVGTQSFNTYGVLAFSNGVLYDSIYNSSGGAGLYALNTATGAGTRKGGVNTIFQNMTLFDAQSLLYGIKGQNLYLINTTTGVASSQGTITGSNLPSIFLAAVNVMASDAPEPASLDLFAIGALSMALRRRRKGEMGEG